MLNLTRVCARLKNHFLYEKFTDTFTLESGSAPLESLLPGQFFVIVGSVLNDGVFQNTAESLEGLKPETFTGKIWSMRVPIDFLDLAEDIERFNSKVEELALLDKGFASESFGGYSYSLNSSAPAYMQEWQRRIQTGLSHYQKIREDI